MSWIKIKHGLLDDPAVIQMAQAIEFSGTPIDEYGVVGRLVKLWQWADLHCVSECNAECNASVTVGSAPGVTGKWIDRYLGVDGFASALVKAGWLTITPGGVQFPNFDRHMSQSAKQRALTAKRVSSHRGKSNASGNPNTVTGPLTESLDREEKIREEKNKKEEEETPPLPPQSKFDKPAKPPKAKPDDVTGLRPELPPELDTPEVHDLWGCWLTIRKAKQKIPFPKRLAEKNIRKMAEWGLAKSLRILERAAAGGWQALNDYEDQPKQSSTGYQKPPPTLPMKASEFSELRRAERERQFINGPNLEVTEPLKQIGGGA